MRKLILLAAAITISVVGNCYAQTDTTSASASMPSAPGCDADVQSSISTASQQGAQDATTRTRQAYTKPPSVLDLSCLGNILRNAGNWDVLATGGNILDAILGAIQQAACSAANQAWNSAMGAAFNPAQLFPRSVTLPGGVNVPVGGGPMSVPDPSNVRVIYPTLPKGVGSSSTPNSQSPSFVTIFQ